MKEMRYGAFVAVATCLSFLTEAVKANGTRPKGDITIHVPDNEPSMWSNIILRVIVLSFYGFFLIWTVYNIV